MCFEVVAQHSLEDEHSLEDFGRYSGKGDEIVRRWCRFGRSENADGVVGKLVPKLNETVRDTWSARISA